MKDTYKETNKSGLKSLLNPREETYEIKISVLEFTFFSKYEHSY